MRSNSNDIRTILETMSKRVNESISASTMSIHNEMSIKFDSLTNQSKQGHYS